MTIAEMENDNSSTLSSNIGDETVREDDPGASSNADALSKQSRNKSEPLLSANSTPQRPKVRPRTQSQLESPEDVRSNNVDDRISLFSEPRTEDRRMLFEELSFSSVPGNLHLSSDEAIERFVQRYGVIDVIRQLAADLAQREAEVGLIRKQHEDRERELRKMLVQCGVSWSDIDKRLMNMSATSVRKPDSMINELMSEAMDSRFQETADSTIPNTSHTTENYKEPEESTALPQKHRKGWVESILGREEEPGVEDVKSNSESAAGEMSASTQDDESRARSISLKDKTMSSASSFQDRGPMELNDIVPQHVQPPTLLPSWNDHYGTQQGQLTDRFGFIYDRNRNSRKIWDSEDDEPQEVQKNQENNPSVPVRKGSTLAIAHDKGIHLGNTEPTQAQSIVTSQAESTIKGQNHGSGQQQEEAPKSGIDSKSSNASGTSGGGSVRMLLAQLTDIHDELQKAQTTRWDEFLRKMNRNSPEIIQNGQLLGVSGAELLSSGRKGGSGKSAWLEFKGLVYGGVPVAYRPKIWGECSGAWTLKVPGKYEAFVNQPPGDNENTEAIEQIELDLYRTMPHNVFFGGTGPGVPKLRRVLVAYSRCNPEVGYCQGMNVIAAILLLTYATEEDAFWSLVSLVENILPEGYFSPPLLTSRADQRVFAKYFAHLLPKLKAKFDDVGVEIDAITFDWFLSCFTDTLPAEVLFRVWDVFLCVEGPAYLFRTALALLKMSEKQLMNLNTGAEVYGFMKNLVYQPIKVDDLIRHTNMYHKHVSDRDLKKFRQVELEKLV